MLSAVSAAIVAIPSLNAANSSSDSPTAKLSDSAIVTGKLGLVVVGGVVTGVSACVGVVEAAGAGGGVAGLVLGAGAGAGGGAAGLTLGAGLAAVAVLELTKLY